VEKLEHPAHQKLTISKPNATNASRRRMSNPPNNFGDNSRLRFAIARLRIDPTGFRPAASLSHVFGRAADPNEYQQ